jgi:alanine-alpha-ketoisovalerate/valine-pyruvate aminotransferase
MCKAIHANLDALTIPSASLTSQPLYSFEIPDGGMFIFIRFPHRYLPLTSEQLFKQLAASGVIIVPGDDFHVPGIDADSTVPSLSSNQDLTLRLTYAAAQPDVIRDGVSRLSRGIENILTTLSK